MKKIIKGLAFLFALFVIFGQQPAAAASCSPTGFFRDGINLTAALINPPEVTGAVDATGCNIGVYYDMDVSGKVREADISGADYFGVAVNGVDAEITGSHIFGIGEAPFNEEMHGVAVYFTDGATGLVDDNTIEKYQKEGIVINGPETTVMVNSNIVTGLGQDSSIAQNGIQFSRGASGTVSANAISEHLFASPANDGSASEKETLSGWQNESSGLLFFNAGEVQNSSNRFIRNKENTVTLP